MDASEKSELPPGREGPDHSPGSGSHTAPVSASGRVHLLHLGPHLLPKPEMIREQHEVSVLGAPQNSGPVMSTVVHVQTEHVVPDHIVWSLFNTLFFNPCCLGFVAFAFSVKSRDRKMVGDVIGAQNHGSTAKSLNIAALVLGIFMTIGLIVLVALYPGLFYVRIGT